MGFTQVHGLDFSKVFDPTLRLETLRLLLSLLGHNGWIGCQVDFKTAFINGNLDKPIFMSQPLGVEDPLHPDWVCKVSRAIYGLKQSPWQWNVELNSALLSLGLTRSSYDPSLYFQLRNGVLVDAVTAHMDDLAIVGILDFFSPFIADLGRRFTIGSDEDLSFFLSISIKRNRKSGTVSIGQQHYISSVASTFLPTVSSPVVSPTSLFFKTLVKRGANFPPSPPQYNQLIGSLLWISQCTRPDVLFAVNKLSQFLQDPSVDHWDAAVRVLCYLSATKDMNLSLGCSHLTLAGFADSD